MDRTPADVEGKDQETFVCPHCRVLSLQILQKPGSQGYEDGSSATGADGKPHVVRMHFQHLIYRCVNCERDTYILRNMGGKRYYAVGGGGSGGGIIPPEMVEIEARVVHYYPVSTYSRHPAVPASVGSAMDEAEKCLAVGAPNACGVMTRRAIHALCQDKGAVGKDLYEQLEYLLKSGQIAEDLWKWAEELRVVGRSGAHPEWEEVTPEEAAYSVRFLEEIVRYVYINPAERNATKLKETKKRTS